MFPISPCKTKAGIGLEGSSKPLASGALAYTRHLLSPACSVFSSVQGAMAPARTAVVWTEGAREGVEDSGTTTLERSMGQGC